MARYAFTCSFDLKSRASQGLGPFFAPASYSGLGLDLALPVTLSLRWGFTVSTHTHSTALRMWAGHSRNCPSFSSHPPHSSPLPSHHPHHHHLSLMSKAQRRAATTCPRAEPVVKFWPSITTKYDLPEITVEHLLDVDWQVDEKDYEKFTEECHNCILGLKLVATLKEYLYYGVLLFKAKQQQDACNEAGITSYTQRG